MNALNGLDMLVLICGLYLLPVVMRKRLPAPAPSPGQAHICASDDDALRDEARRAAWAEVLNDDYNDEE